MMKAYCFEADRYTIKFVEGPAGIIIEIVPDDKSEKFLINNVEDYPGQNVLLHPIPCGGRLHVAWKRVNK